MYKFLDGGGEMGGLIRDFAWSRTPLGPVETWPQSLKTSVSLMLSSQHAIWIGWGPDATFLYNDAYIQVLSSAKHPVALGQPTADVWSEIWDVCGPLAEKVFNKGEATFVDDVRLFMNRGDFLEETFYSFSYSPIRDESGKVSGLFCPSTEVTPKMLNARRLRTLSELASESLLERSTERACASAAAILAQNPDDIPFALLYLIDAEGRTAHLMQTVGIPNGTSFICPQAVDLGQPNNSTHVWPIAEVAGAGLPQVTKLAGIAGFPTGAGDQPVREALVVPVMSRGYERPLGILVAGVNPARRLDSEYRTFYELVARQFSMAIQNARAAEEESRRANLLAALDQAKTTFFSNVSHELRTPLTLMLGPLEDEMRENPSASERLEVVHRNSLRLLKLVNTLLDFSRIEAGRVEASFEPTDLALFTKELASVFRSAAEKAGLRFLVDCPPLSEPTFIDREMWEKIVLNLLSNALKFTKSGEIEVKLIDGQGTGTRCVCLAVRDTGIGIPAEELPRVFERFHRIKSPWARSHEGTGIGLALVQELALQHGGYVQVASEVGKGTTFTVWIPMGSAHLASASIRDPRALTPSVARARSFLEETQQWLPDARDGAALLSPTPTADALSPGYILLADDNGDMRGYVQRLLTGSGFEVVAVENGEIALESARKCPPSLVLSDVMMPRLDGFGLLKQLRDDPATQSIPIILLSARAGEEARVEGVAAGADDYLTKPFSARELLARVTTHLELARMRKEAQRALAESEERLKALMEALPVGVSFSSDSTCREIVGNTTLRRQFEANDGDNISASAADPHAHGRRIKFYREGRPISGAELPLQRAVAENREIPPMELEIEMPSGKRWFAEASGAPIRDPDGNVLAGVAVTVDVTKQKQAEIALHAANSQLASKAVHLESLVQQRTSKLLDTLGELEAFSYSIAHDMRAPLRSLQGFSDILLTEYADKLDAQGQRFLIRIADAAGRMDKLIRDVLDYSRVVRGDLPLEKVDVKQLLHGIVETYPLLGPDHADVALEGPFPPVLGNEAMVMQIFSNLMGNAIKFVAPGVKPRLRIYSEIHAPTVRYLIQDNGIGIAPDQHEKIFSIFQQVKKNPDGTGIGLSIVKKAAERMGGKVGVFSDLDRGSTFWVELQGAETPGD
jgi:signal transduction histidine kinase/FixJ family two-component response regulator